MKERLQGLVAGVLIGSTILGGAAYAVARTEKIDVLFDNIEIVVDGEKIDARDANGQKVEPFVYNGTTYLPVRAIGDAIGKDVLWDGVEKVVYLGTKPGDAENWLDVCGPYQYQNGEEYRLKDNKYFTMSGKKYTNGFVLSDANKKGMALFNLDGKYDSVTFTVGHIDDTALRNVPLEIYIDGIIAYETEIKATDVARKITIPLNKALQMKIVTNKNTNTWMNARACWGFSEGVFE